MGNGNFYRATMTKQDVFAADTQLLTLNEFIKIGEYKVLADELVGMGYGAGTQQDNAAGRIYADFKDTTGTPVAIGGTFRIMMMSSQNIPLGEKPVILDIDVAILRGSTNRSEQLPFDFQNVFLSKDKKFVFYIKNVFASAQTVSKANSTVYIDITKQLV